uniref:P2X purinoreceptor 7 intracellular domain-containing protein n=1 Tax=Panagrolaimus superbus TaxID=310955 RepID=A0A914YVA3_9BILA
MDPRAFAYFPTTQPVASKKSNYCVLLDKDVGERSSIEYCKCGKCVIQPTSVENICCKETLENNSKYSKNVCELLGDHRCICDSAIVRDYVYRKQELELWSMFDNWKSRSDKQIVSSLDPHRHIRFAAYQKLTFLFHGVLGMKKRVELPSCLVDFIRKQYPNPDGVYIGFKNAEWTDE